MEKQTFIRLVADFIAGIVCVLAARGVAAVTADISRARKPKPKLRAYEACGGPGPTLWEDAPVPDRARYLCRNCHSAPDDPFFTERVS